jgi:hypothetical protein
VAPLEMSPEEFRRLGHQLVDRIAEFLRTIREDPVTPGETPAQLRGLLGRPALAAAGAAPAALLAEAADLVIAHSLRNGHPRFMGYITSSAAPIGALGDLLAAAVNPNVGAWELAPAAVEIEAQTIRWIAELVGYPADCGGLLVSGGNMATSSASWPDAGPSRAKRSGRCGWARSGTGCTSPAPPTPGSRRRPTSSASAPMPSAGSPPTSAGGWIRPRSGAGFAPTRRPETGP